MEPGAVKFSDRARSNGHKQKHRRFCLNIPPKHQEELYWHRLPKEAVLVIQYCF